MKIVALLMSGCLALAGNAHAADIAAGKAKAAVCAACHGDNGIGTAPLYPNLAGQKAPYLLKQLKAFKAGERTDQSMTLFVTPLSEADMENIAAYFASLPPGGQPAAEEKPAEEKTTAEKPAVDKPATE